MVTGFNCSLIGLVMLVVCSFACTNKIVAEQEGDQMVRIAKIKVDPAQLDQYNAALKEQMKTAIKIEAGVISYHAVADKKDPSNITILEIYADTTAYQLHIATEHFKRYKETVVNMVKSLELIDVTTIGESRKAGR